MRDKIIEIRISHLIMGAIILLLLWFTFIQPSPSTLSKYDKQKREIDSLLGNIKKLHVLNKSFWSQISSLF